MILNSTIIHKISKRNLITTVTVHTTLEAVLISLT